MRDSTISFPVVGIGEGTKMLTTMLAGSKVRLLGYLKV